MDRHATWSVRTGGSENQTGGFDSEQQPDSAEWLKKEIERVDGEQRSCHCWLVVSVVLPCGHWSGVRSASGMHGRRCEGAGGPGWCRNSTTWIGSLISAAWKHVSGLVDQLNTASAQDPLTPAQPLHSPLGRPSPGPVTLFHDIERSTRYCRGLGNRALPPTPGQCPAAITLFRSAVLTENGAMSRVDPAKCGHTMDCTTKSAIPELSSRLNPFIICRFASPVPINAGTAPERAPLPMEKRWRCGPSRHRRQSRHGASTFSVSILRYAYRRG